MDNLREYVINYKNEAGKIVCNIEDYYRDFIIPLDSKFRGQVLTPKHLAMCPLHDDHDPSFSMLKDKHRDGVYLYHCFGCNQTGDIVSLYQKIQAIYFNTHLNTETCCKELCQIFNIPLPSQEDLQDVEPEVKFMNKYNNITKLMGTYTEAEFKRNLMHLRAQGNVDLNKVNFECIKLIMTQKGVR